jgi:hypothetical protein
MFKNYLAVYFKHLVIIILTSVHRISKTVKKNMRSNADALSVWE